LNFQELFKKAPVVIGFIGIAACTAPGDILEVPEKPESQRKTVSIILEPVEPTQNLEENVVLSRQHTITAGASVVISVPSEHAKRRSEYEKQVSNAEYSTDAFFNEAEQQIERSLIQHGFRVLSREKFEAKLRDMRDAAVRNDNRADDYVGGRSDYERQLNELLAKNEIGPDEYAQKLKEFDKATKIASSGVSEKGRQELTDISEVIRAAQSGDVQSDYILQINRFDEVKPVPYTINLEHYDAYKSLMSEFQSAQETLFNRRKQTCTAYEASLNAKLIDVDTGDIVWIGDHSLMSASASTALPEFKVSVHKTVDNASEVENFVREQNSPELRNQRGSTLTETVLNKGKPVKKAIKIPEYSFRTEVVGPIIADGQCDEIDLSRASEQQKGDLYKMKKQVSKAVAKELIGTIKVH